MTIRSLQRVRVLWLRQVRLHAASLQLLDDEPPAGAVLDREGNRPLLDQCEPVAECCSRPRTPTPSNLAGLSVEVVKGDLAAVHV